MVRMPLQRLRAVKLFGKHDPDQAMRPGQRRQRPAEVGPCSTPGESIGTANQERQIATIREPRSSQRASSAVVIARPVTSSATT